MEPMHPSQLCLIFILRPPAPPIPLPIDLVYSPQAVDLETTWPVRNLPRATTSWSSSAVAPATDVEVSVAAFVLSRWASIEEETGLLEILNDCVLERSMAEGPGADIEGRFKMSPSVARWAKGGGVIKVQLLSAFR